MSERVRATSRPAAGARRLTALSLTALGVVYGDIGTSPLYAFRECFKAEYGIAVTPDAVYGVLSMIVWALILTVSVKYLVFIMRADNHGEGGVLALLALIRGSRRGLVISLGLFGAALLYGDGVITPSISVLSAVEGTEIAAPALSHLVVPATLAILFALFVVQRNGTARVGSVFGPVMLVWFVTIAALGAGQIVRHPGVVGALNPWHAARFFVDHHWAAFRVLGAVVLAVTGAEALYADMGHFGRQPIRLAWFTVVFPSLLLNYFGQGALLITTPDAIRNPFYMLAPDVALVPLVVLSTAATVIASQALISGTFSLTHQSMQLRYSPRMTVVHTSREERGQIYIPEVNRALMIGCLALVLGFRSSTSLAAAYGIAVTGTMAITTVLFYMVARDRWRWSALHAGTIAASFIVVDLAFFGANALKIRHGGWVPLVIASAVFLVMTTWNRGTALVNRMLASRSAPLDRFLEDFERNPPPRVPGTAVFLTPTSEGVPPVLLLHLRHNKALQEDVVLLSIVMEEVPDVPSSQRLEVTALPHGFHRVRAHYGFMETPDVQDIVRRCCDRGVRASTDSTTYYLGRATLVPTGKAPMMRWRKQLFAFMARNASSATDFFGIPRDAVVELGAQLEL